METSLLSAFGRPLLPFTGINGRLSGGLDGADNVGGVSPGLSFLEDSLSLFLPLVERDSPCFGVGSTDKLILGLAAIRANNIVFY